MHHDGARWRVLWVMMLRICGLRSQCSLWITMLTHLWISQHVVLGRIYPDLSVLWITGLRPCGLRTLERAVDYDAAHLWISQHVVLGRISFWFLKSIHAVLRVAPFLSILRILWFLNLHAEHSCQFVKFVVSFPVCSVSFVVKIPREIEKG